jgi:hypothetical protein
LPKIPDMIITAHKTPIIIHHSEIISPVVKNNTPIRKITRIRFEIPGKKREYNRTISGAKKE